MKDFHLERIDPEKNCYRYYGISLEENLFGDRSVIVRWGRIGRARRQRIDASGEAGEMVVRAQKLATQKLRRGYVKT